jgi:hypothetical protein
MPKTKQGKKATIEKKSEKAKLAGYTIAAKTLQDS